MRRRKVCVLGLLVGIAVAVHPALAGVKEGVDAWQAGDYAKAVAEWRGPAQKGDADAQFNLGQAYKLGRGVAQDSAAAQSWYLKAAEKGHEQAQANLGLILFQNGDRQGAMPWIRKAAEHGEARAQYVLGTAMFNGDLVARDWPRAYALMSRSAAAGLPQAATSLQQMEQYLTPADRQAGLALASEMAKGGAAMAAATTPAARPTAKPAAPKPAPAPKPVKVAEARPAPAPVAASSPAPQRAPAAVKPVDLPPSTPVPPPTAPSPAAAPVTPATAPASGWKVQLGAFGTEAAAHQAWMKIAAQPALKGVSPVYAHVNALTRLQAGPFASRAAAGEACAALKDVAAGCFPVAP